MIIEVLNNLALKNEEILNLRDELIKALENNKISAEDYQEELQKLNLRNELIKILEINNTSEKSFRERALEQFADNNKDNDLTQDAIIEAQSGGLNPEKYRTVLKLILHPDFFKDSPIIIQAVNQYNKGKIDDAYIDKLFSINAISALASLYPSYYELMPIYKLLLLNSQYSVNEKKEENNLNEESKESAENNSAEERKESAEERSADVQGKITFAHALFDLPPSIENRKAILNFFMRLNKLAKLNNDLVRNYLNLFDESGKSILQILDEKSSANAVYSDFNKEVREACFEIFPRAVAASSSSAEVIVNTHTASIHSSVDESLVKLALNYKAENINQLTLRTVAVNRDAGWEKRVNQDIGLLKAKVSEIIDDNGKLETYIEMPQSAQAKNREELKKYKFYSKTALKLINGLIEGQYGNKYIIKANEPVTCGLTLKEIVAIGFNSLNDVSRWENPEKEKAHFLQFIESLYIAMRGYNIDKNGSNEWKNSDINNSVDYNKCLSGTVNQVIRGLNDHKDVAFKIVDSVTMRGPLYVKLPDILKALPENPETQQLLISWQKTCIMSEALKTEILKLLKCDASFLNEFSSSEIENILPVVLNKFNNNEIKEILSKASRERISSGSGSGDTKALINNFIFHETKGYVPYLEFLWNQDRNEAENLFKILLKQGIIASSIDLNNQDAYASVMIINLIFSSKDKDFTEVMFELLNAHFEATKTSKDQYLKLTIEYDLREIAIKLIDLGADFFADDLRQHSNKLLNSIISNKDLYLLKLVLKKFPNAINIVPGFGDTVLHAAANAGSIDILKYLLETYPVLSSINMKIKARYDDCTPLHIMASNINFDIAKNMLVCLYKKFPDKFIEVVGIEDGEGKTPLHIALDKNNADLAKYMLVQLQEKSPEKLAEILNIVDLSLKIPLMYAIENKFLDLVKVIINFNQKIDIFEGGKTVLHHYAEIGDLHMVQFIVELLPNSVNSIDDGGNSALHFAARGDEKNLDTVRYLADVSPNSVIRTNKLGETAFYSAIRASSLEIVKYFLNEHPATKGICNKDGATALHVAAEEAKNLDIIKYLIKEHPDLINIVDGDGATIMHYSIQPQKTKALDYFSKQYPQIAAKADSAGDTLMHYAIRIGAVPTGKVLKLFPELTNVPNHAGVTPLFALVQSRRLTSIKVFVSESKDVDINDVDGSGNTLLHLIMLHELHGAEKSETVRELINILKTKGFNFLKRNNDGKTALEVLQEKCKNEPSRTMNTHNSIRKELLSTLAILGKEQQRKLEEAEAQAKMKEAEAQAKLSEAKAKAIAKLREDLNLVLEEGDFNSIKNLLEQNDNINELDGYKETVLHKIVTYGNIPIKHIKGVIQILVRKGIDFDLKNKNGKTALDIVQENLNQGLSEFDKLMEEAIMEHKNVLSGNKRSLEDNNHGSSSSYGSSSKLQKVGGLEDSIHNNDIEHATTASPSSMKFGGGKSLANLLGSKRSNEDNNYGSSSSDGSLSKIQKVEGATALKPANTEEPSNGSSSSCLSISLGNVFPKSSFIQDEGVNHNSQPWLRMFNSFVPRIEVETYSSKALQLGSAEIPGSAQLQHLNIKNAESREDAKPSSADNLDKMAYQATVLFKTLDASVDIFKVVHEPNFNNFNELVRDVAHLGLMYSGANFYLSLVSALDVFGLVYEGEYAQAMLQTSATIGYAMLPILGASPYNIPIIAYTGFKTLNNLYTVYKNYGTPEDMLKSNLAYANLEISLGLKNLAKECLKNAVEIVKNDFEHNHDYNSSIQKIAEESNLIGKLCELDQSYCDNGY